MPFGGNSACLGPTAGAFQLSKSRSCSLLFIEQLMLLSICYPSRNAGSSQKRGRREAVNGCGVITLGIDQRAAVSRLESLAPTLSANVRRRAGHRREGWSDSLVSANECARSPQPRSGQALRAAGESAGVRDDALDRVGFYSVEQKK
jgi:hypothetical protein